MGTQINTNGPFVPRSMTETGARDSYFIEKMSGEELDNPRTIDPGNLAIIDHTQLLTAGELKMITEWLDQGGQNFNDLFDPAAPQN